MSPPLDLGGVKLHSASMRQPDSLTPLIDLGIIQEVVRPLMSGKEAQVYLVVSDDELRVAKVYKAAHDRTFRQRAEYTEGRSVRNTRTQRAMSRHSRHGRAQEEASWRTAEVEIIYRLREAGVRVPAPYHFSDGVLVMEMISGHDGQPAPRLADVELSPADARVIFDLLLAEVVKMLCAGVVHGDLSEFNVLLGQEGPVLIDFPQAVDPARNQSARRLLIRDVDNLHRLVVRAAPSDRRLPFGQEMWEIYLRGELRPDTPLVGRYRPPGKKADTSAVLYEIDVAARDAKRRQEAQKPAPSSRRRRGRKKKPAAKSDAASAATKTAPASSPPDSSQRPPAAREKAASVPKAKPAPASGERRRRRRKRGGSGGRGGGKAST